MDEQISRLKEYELLRQELLQAENLIQRTIVIIISATAIIVGQGLIGQNPWIFLFSLPILTIAYYYISDMRLRILVIGSYIYIFHEEERDPGLNWEKSLRYFRVICKDQNVPFWGRHFLIRNDLILFNILMAFVIMLFFWKINNKLFVILPFAFWLTFSAFFIRISKKLRREGRPGDMLSKIWKEVRARVKSHDKNETNSSTS